MLLAVSLSKKVCFQEGVLWIRPSPAPFRTRRGFFLVAASLPPPKKEYEAGHGIAEPSGSAESGAQAIISGILHHHTVIPNLVPDSPRNSTLPPFGMGITSPASFT